MSTPDSKDSALDSLVRGITEAVTDIRQKVVEAPWFGDAVTQRMQGEQVPVQEKSTSPYALEGMPETFEEYIKQYERKEQGLEKEKIKEKAKDRE